MNDSVSSTGPVSHDEWWAVAVIKNGKIMMLVEGYPKGEDSPDDIRLTKAEFYFLRSLPHQWMDMRKLRNMAGRIQTKINKVKNENRIEVHRK